MMICTSRCPQALARDATEGTESESHTYRGPGAEVQWLSDGGFRPESFASSLPSFCAETNQYWSLYVHTPDLGHGKLGHRLFVAHLRAHSISAKSGSTKPSACLDRFLVTIATSS